MNISEKEVTKALSTVLDPDIKRDLVTLNMVHDIRVEGNSISFTVVLTTPACPLKEQIRRECIEAVERVAGKAFVINVNITSSVTSLRTNAPLLPQVKNIVPIASGKGGVGKSTITTNLAVALGIISTITATWALIATPS